MNLLRFRVVGIFIYRKMGMFIGLMPLNGIMRRNVALIIEFLLERRYQIILG